MCETVAKLTNNEKIIVILILIGLVVAILLLTGYIGLVFMLPLLAIYFAVLVFVSLLLFRLYKALGIYIKEHEKN